MKLRLGRFVRITFGLGLIGLATAITVPRLTHRTSVDAVVNGRLIQIRAPIEGRLTVAPPPVGSRVLVGSPIAIISNTRQSRAALAQLSTNAATLQERIDALVREDAELARLQDELAERVRAYRDATLNSLREERRELAARLRGARARLAQLASDLHRQVVLSRDGHQSQAARERALSAYEQAAAEEAALTAAINRIALRIEAATSGTYVAEGQNDVPYSQQRIDDVAVRRRDVATRLAEAETRLRLIAEQIAIECERIVRAGASLHLAPANGVVWRNLARGGDVTVGDAFLELLDCDDVFVEAAFDEEALPDLRSGATVQIRFGGSPHSIDGWIRSVRGGRDVGDTLLAADLPRADRQVRAAIDFDRAARGIGSADFCHVGRGAKVSVRRDVGRGWRAWLAGTVETAASLWTPAGG